MQINHELNHEDFAAAIQCPDQESAGDGGEAECGD